LHGTPGGRLTQARNARSFERQGLFVVAPERPGYGASTPAPGRKVIDFAQDVIAVLDSCGINGAMAVGGSSGGPDALALAALAPERISSVGVMVGAAPLTPDELTGIVGVNQQILSCVHDAERLRELVIAIRHDLLDQGLHQVLADAPERDRKLLAEDLSQRQAALVSALEPGIDGMVDDYRAVFGRSWGFEPEDVKVPVVWAHGNEDRNVPIAAARRYADRLPQCTFLTWEGVGHSIPNDLQAEVLTAVLAAYVKQTGGLQLRTSFIDQSWR